MNPFNNNFSFIVKAYFGLCLCGLLWIGYIFSFSLGFLGSDYLNNPPSNDPKSIRRFMNSSEDLSTPTKHTEGFLCMAYFGDLGIPGSAPPCSEGTDEMFYDVHKPSLLLFRLCCSLEHKKDRGQCGVLVRCGPSTTQHHCPDPNARFLNNLTKTTEPECEGVAGAGGWCPLEDEGTCCIVSVVQNQAGTTMALVAHQLKTLWRIIRFVYYWAVMWLIVMPPFYIFIGVIYEIGRWDVLG